MDIRALTAELALKYKAEITRFYYDNVRSAQFFEHYTLEEAEAKIDGFIGYLETDKCIAFGAFENNEIIGFIWAYAHPFREELRMYVNEIRVLEGYRRRCIGEELLKSVEKKAKKKGIKTVYLHAEGNNFESRKFYDSCGYTEERIQLRKEI